ncbi:Methyltransferase, type 11 family [uncultured delta proteobacterium]|uniref:Methyltransferase, type 11 family n=1 Tax=uncultured delta proteobacterium TaxID=34034 RepID=A0A212ITZ9_9DELT|nr:Methyltransferase, type 11 family [uncultured delta proteobacterium]
MQKNSSVSKAVLHVGCGVHTPDKLHETFRGPGWREVRLDINPAVNPDILASITDMQGVADASFEALYSSHNLEHLHPHEVPLALAEFKRVLKPYGFALITVPDLRQAAQCIAEDKAEEPVLMTNKGPITPLDILYGFRPFLANGNLFMAHNFGFTAATLRAALADAGFCEISVEPDGEFNLWATASPSAALSSGKGAS